MSRSGPAPLLAALAGGAVFASECLVLQTRTGTLAGFTALDEATVIDLTADDGPGPVTCEDGMVLSAITLAVGLDASFAEVTGPLGPVVTEAGVNGGRWDDALAWLVRISPGVAGYVPVLAGKVREARVEGASFVLEIRNQADELNQTYGRTVSAYCDATFGDIRCGLTLVPVAATITAVTDAMRFAVSYSGTHATGFFDLGKVIFTGGALDGETSDNLFAFTSAGAGAGSIELFEPLPEAPTIGDTLDLYQGCAKTRPACMAYLNIANNRSFPDVPGSDQVLSYPNPGA